MGRSTAKKKRTIHAGDHVGVRLGDRVLPAIILEDRGTFGPKGLHLVRVELSKAETADSEPDRFEVPQSALVFPANR